MSVERELELRIAALEWQQFERLVYDLVEGEFPEAVKTTPPDGGADVILLRRASQAPEVFQVKHFTKTFVWQQCEQSLDRCLSYKPARVTFVFPRDLNGGHIETFKRRLVQRHPEVEVGAWTLSKLRTLLQRHRTIRVRYFGEDLQTALLALAEREKPENFFERVIAVATSADDDPAYDYTAVVGKSGKLTPASEAHVTVKVRDGERWMSLMAEPRGPALGHLASWSFRDDDEGRAARNEALLAVARGDSEVVIERGITVGWHNAPGRVRKTLDEARAEFGDLAGRLTLKPGPAIPLRVTVHGANEVIEREFGVYPFPASEEFDRVYVGLDRGMKPYIGFRLPERPKVEMAFKPLLHLGASAQVNEEATGFLLAFLTAQRIELRSPLFPDGGLTVDPQLMHGGPDLAGAARELHALYAAVAFIEREIGVNLPVPDPPFSDAQLHELADAAETLRMRRGRGQLHDLEIETPPDQVQATMHRLATHPQVAFPVHVDILGHPVLLGRGLGRLPDVRVVALPPLLALPRPTVTVKAYPAEGQGLDFRLLEPEERPPADALRWEPKAQSTAMWLPEQAPSWQATPWRPPSR